MICLGIDIGGANTKVATADRGIVELHHLPLWKDAKLPDLLRDINARIKPNIIGVVITGELADCFEDKIHGLKYIMQAIDNVFPKVYYIGNNGNIVQTEEDIIHLAAANWAASSKIIGEEVNNCVFVDVGSTTSDIIPIVNSNHVAHVTDFTRLIANELVYMGILRTNVATLVDKVQVNAGICRVSSELFATTGDVYLLLDDIKPSTFTTATADGEGITKLNASRRIARLVCADLTEISHPEVIKIAHQIKTKQINLLYDAIAKVTEKYNLNKIVSAGIGEFMIKDVAAKLNMELISVSKKWGEDISSVFPAYAAACIVKRYINSLK